MKQWMRQSDKKQQRSIVAYYPLQAGDKKWVLFVVAPYNQIISPVRKTFVYTLFVSLLLIGVVIVAGMSFAYKEGKRLRIKEEQRKIKGAGGLAGKTSAGKENHRRHY